MSHVPTMHLPNDELDRYLCDLHDPEEWRGNRDVYPGSWNRIPILSNESREDPAEGGCFYRSTKTPAATAAAARSAPRFESVANHLWTSLAHGGLALNSFLRAWLSLAARFCLAVLEGLAELDSQFETKVSR
jgi:hypothetical protein